MSVYDNHQQFCLVIKENYVIKGVRQQTRTVVLFGSIAI